MDVEITHAFLSYEDKISCEGVMILLGKNQIFSGDTEQPPPTQIKVPGQHQSQGGGCGMRAVDPAEEWKKKEMGKCR